MELREQLAEAEHEQWIRWAKNLIPELKQLTQFHLPYGDERESGNCHCKTCERIKRWESLMIPYSELTEAQKQQDRNEVPMSLVTAAIEAAKTEQRIQDDVKRATEVGKAIANQATKCNAAIEAARTDARAEALREVREKLLPRIVARYGSFYRPYWSSNWNKLSDFQKQQWQEDMDKLLDFQTGQQEQEKKG